VTSTIYRRRPNILILLVLSGLLVPRTGFAQDRVAKQKSPFPVVDSQVARYTAYRSPGKITIDGRPDEAAWKTIPRSPRFVDLISGQSTIHSTRAAVTWDDTMMYVAFWIEEPFVEATLTKRDSPIYQNNDVEVFIAGKDAYYEFEINSFGTIYEGFFIWQEAYVRGGFSKAPEFQLTNPGAQPFNGVGFKTHPRGKRHAFLKWDFPGAQTAVHIDGTIIQNNDRDHGWTAELAFPWKGMQWLARADGRALPPQNGDRWRIDFSRFNQYKAAPPARDSGGWAWSHHGIWDSHIPEAFPYVTFSTKTPPASN